MRFTQRKNHFIQPILTFLIILLFTAQIFSFMPETSNSAEAAETTTYPTLSRLMYQRNNDGSPKGYRAYMEYALQGTTDSTNLGILRQTVLYVYACAGETICLGSDITGSLITEDEVLETSSSANGKSGVDIVLTAPDGTRMTFNNEKNGVGYIGTLAQEAAGVNYTGSNNTAGYTPHEYTVRTTGIYEVRFHSYSGSINKGTTDTHMHTGTNPDPISANNNNWKNSGVTIGAFDITVVLNGTVKTGRSYAKYLALNTGQYYTGANTKRDFAGEFYNVTTDGYIYKNTFDICPWGFIFFTNSRGLVDTTTGNSVYHSYRTSSGDVKDVSEKTIRELGGSLHKPGDTDTALDQTYMTFFEMPDENLEGVLYQRAYAPEVIDDFTFVGAKEANITYVGSGGYFKFDVKNAMAVTISISFEEYNKAHNTNYQPVQIKSSVEKGTNYIFWDGNDGAGTEVDAGWYKSDQIEVKIQSHAGEYHFPFIDVEDSFGLTFERVNKIYDFKNGVLTDVTKDYETSKYTIYYDNRAIEGVSVKKGSGITVLGDTKNCSTGVDSQNSVMSFVRSSSGEVGPGDATIIDIWTYALSEIQEMTDTDLVIRNLDGYYPITLEGFVFFDKDNNSTYDLSLGDFALSDVEVTLDYKYCGTRWTITTDESTGKVTRLQPAYFSTTNEDGYEVREYYYHDYEVRLGKDNLYYLYQYAASNTSHVGEPNLVLDTDGNPVTVTPEKYTYVEKDSDGQEITITDYKVWIPVHLETTTNSVGMYRFTGVLINKNGYRNQDANGVYDNFTITVKNPDKDVYILTTAKTTSESCDFPGLTGTETQVIRMEELFRMAQASEAAKTDLIYDVSDVGYYYETYEPPLTVVKIWGSEADYSQVQSITFTIEGFITDEGDHYGEEAYTREVTILYSDGWDLTLTDLPAKATIGNEEYTLSYRLTCESFSNLSGTYRYTVSGGWEQLVTDENGKQSWVKYTDGAYNEVYAAYFSELQHAITGDYLYASNFPAGSSLINLYKKANEDLTTPLSGATFLLQKLEGTTYVDVTTSQGSYLVTTDNDGYARFLGLTTGTYRLVEVVAPEHYRTISDVTFSVPLAANYNGSVTLDPDSDEYNVTIYDRLIDAPVSELQKYDQYGNPIEGAEFEVYAADADYNIVNKTPLSYSLYDDSPDKTLVLRTGSDGKAQFMVEGTSGTRAMTIPELRRLSEQRVEGGTDYFVLKETKVPAGYRSVGEAHMMIVGSGMSSYIFCMNPYESGVWCMASATVYAPEVLQEAGTDQTFQYISYSDNGNASANGTLFAVVLKRNGAEAGVTSLDSLTIDGWEPIYGTDTGGYHVLSLGGSTDRAVQTAAAIKAYKENDQRSLFTQDLEDPTHISVHLTNFPGDILEYYTNVLNNGTAVDNDTPEYVVAYYYSTASDADSITASNTYRVTSHAVGTTQVQSFPIYWSTTINVPDIRNALFVQKTIDEDSDDSANLIDDAVFGLYEAAVDSSGNGYYVGTDANNNTVYILLAENDSLTAEVYSGTVTDGILTVSQKISSGTATYTVNTTGCEEAPESLTDNDGYVNGEAGSITVTESVEMDTGDIVETIWTIVPAKNAKGQRLTAFTHDECEYVKEKGTAHLYYLTEGNYFLKEIYVPSGFKLNYTNVEVIVTDHGVFANAGGTDDGVVVGNGAGYLVSTLNNFASIGDINETLSYIVAALRLRSGNSFLLGDELDNSNWPYVSLDANDTTKYLFSGSEATGVIADSTVLYLKYNGSANADKLETPTIFDYTVNEKGANNAENLINSVRYWTKSGWSTLGIFQHHTFLKNNVSQTVSYTNLTVKEGSSSEWDISNLFSSSTFVRVEDETVKKLQLDKVDSKGDAVEGAGFVLYRMKNGEKQYYTVEDGNVVFRPLNSGEEAADLALSTKILETSDATDSTQTADSSGSTDTGGLTGNDDSTDSEETTETEKARASILFGELSNGDYFLREVSAPEGYRLLDTTIKITVDSKTITAVNLKTSENLTVVRDSEVSDDGTWHFTLTLVNHRLDELPSTGGMGTLWMILVGVALVVLGLIIRQNHKQNPEKPTEAS